MKNIKNRRDIVVFCDFKNSNPNGDPDADNEPRKDVETGIGIISDAAIKSWIRRSVELIMVHEDDYQKGYEEGYEIYIKQKSVLTTCRARAFEGFKPTQTASKEQSSSSDDSEESKSKKPQKKSEKSNEAEKIAYARMRMIQIFWDVKTFGAVCSFKANNAGTITGIAAVQFANSLDPISTKNHSLVLNSVQTEAESAAMAGHNTTFGSKWTIPYGCYRFTIPISAVLAEDLEYTEKDYDLLIFAIQKMFSYHTSGTGQRTVRAMYVFEHTSAMGNAQSGVLSESIKATKNPGVTHPRDFSDYTITTPTGASLPKGVTLYDITNPGQKTQL